MKSSKSHGFAGVGSYSIQCIEYCHGRGNLEEVGEADEKCHSLNEPIPPSSTPPNFVATCHIFTDTDHNEFFGEGGLASYETEYFVNTPLVSGDK